MAGDGTWQDVGSTLCEWNVTAGDLTTGYVGACNEGDVGIGGAFIQPNTELTVFRQTDGATSVRGIYSSVNNNTSGSTATAIDGYARSVVPGILPAFQEIIGVRGVADVGTNCFLTSIGVYGEANGSSSCGGVYAGYFEGPVYATSYSNGSDEMLKQEISDIPSGLELISQIEPKSYYFRTNEFPTLHLDEGLHYGVIAQQLEEVLPDAVTVVNRPAKYDEEGNLIGEAISFKSVDYNELIPILIKATQEQQALIDQQQTQINDLMDVVSACSTS